MNILCDFDYYAPSTMGEMLDLVAKFGSKAKIMAGGTDLVIMLKEQMIETENIIDINNVPDIKGIKVDASGASIGAATKLTDIEFSEELKKDYGALVYAAGEVGSNQVRIMGTLGGNTCHSSPAAETPPILSAYGAKVVIASKNGEREMPIEDFIQGNRKNDLKEGEMLARFVLPPMEPKSGCKYRGIGLRNAMEIDCANMGVKVVLENDGETIKSIKLVMGSVFIRPLVSAKVPELLVGKKLTDDLITQAGLAAQSEAKPIDDVRASAAYRKEVIDAMARQLIKEAYEQAKGA